MENFYTNLPPKEQDNLDKTIEKLTSGTYDQEFQFSPGDYDSTVAFFVKRGFSRLSAESTAYVSQEILDKLGYADEATLSELITIILNANRYKSSRLGVRQTLATKETVSRNIID